MPVTVIKDIAVDFGSSAFIAPYLERELGITDADEPVQPKAGVRIITDDDAPDTDTEFDIYCHKRNLPILVLRCPYIVGTGMTGLMLRIAAGIYKGSFVHIKGNEARISVVHAVDVARAINRAAGQQGTYILTDCTNPTIHDLAEALAFRIEDKRIVTIKTKWARLWYGKRYFNTLTTSHTAESTFTKMFPDFHPLEVTHYLRTHVYDEQSL